jgi:hypothetical protein
MVPCCGSIVLGELEALTNALASDEPGSAQAALRLAKQFNDNLILVYDTDIASQTKPKVIRCASRRRRQSSRCKPDEQ